MLRSILHCDMNNFYASVECMLDPALKKYPIAVCGSVEERHGIVLAKNYKAKAFDVKTGDAVWQAKQKCKDLVVVPPHYEEYIKYSKLARSVYERYTDQVEPYGMDECWLDISGTESLFGSPEKVANEIRETMKFELGLTISVGVSFNKIFAKLGSDMKKPDAVTVIPKDTFKEKIWGLPAADLLGVGRATQRVLDSYCIRTIGDLANTDPEFLRRRLGKNGVVLWNYVISEYPKFDVEKRWLYYIALLICGVKNNDYLKLALNKTSKSSELIKNIFRSVLDIDWKSENYQKLYRQRKSLISELKKPLPETIDFCKILSTKGEDEIYYLTDLTQPEKEKIIKWLSNYGVKYSKDELVSILMNVYPDLAYYLSSYRYRNEFLNTYFENYKYQKITNRILPSFDKVVEEQAIKMDFVTILKPRTAYVDQLDTQNAQVFFVDAMGVEYLSFIQQKCSEYGLSANISCARCELPSLTVFNKEFVDVLKDKGCLISDIKDLDDIKHHGKDSFDYEKEKTPIYLIKELEIIDDLLTKIKASILAGSYNKAIIISDHGASRLAVLHETENIWNMETKGEHSGRCCKISEIDDKPDFAIEESGYWILANYDRFRGSRRANVEVHGGASMEEVAVPIIEITQKASNIEAFIVDESRVLTLGAKECKTPCFSLISTKPSILCMSIFRKNCLPAFPKAESRCKKPKSHITIGIFMPAYLS